MGHQLAGIILMATIGACLFSRPIDVMFFTACMYCLCFVLAELGVWLGFVERK